MTPTTPLRECEWIAPQRVKALERLGLESVEDLLTHFPRRYEDRTRFDHFPQDETAEPVCICGLIKKTALRRIRGRQKMFDAVLEEETATILSTPITLRWFNAHWVEKALATGQRVVVYGKPKRSGSQVVIAHPEFEIVDDDAEVSIHLDRIAPVHRASEGLSARVLRRIIWDTLQQLDPAAFPNLVPPALDKQPRIEALRQIHFPDSHEALQLARRHLVLEEFFALQLSVAARRVEHGSRPGQAHCGAGELLARFHASLPFPLTGAQQRAIAEIRTDLASPHPMNRLLHGDVGSGKTLVALSAMLLCVEAGYQAALMAPTQILAEQHYLTLHRLCEPLGLRVALRTGSRKEEAAPLPLFAAAKLQVPGGALGSSAGSQAILPNHLPHLVVGTHALLYEGAGLEKLGLAVIDEQHKFGVLQRAKLIAQGAAPDVLVMTATPIPRTLTMTVYGDLDVSTLDEMPANRGKIITALRDPSKLPDAVAFIRQQLEAGRQAYIVYPLIDASESVEAKAAAAEYARWQGLLAPFRCELLHGRIAPEEKDAIMERFRKCESQVLVATTVIEVGIDVPNSSLMLIESAERFGLAQLHQLRGRIGRGPHKSYCILISDTKEEAALEKLQTLERTSNGFDIAEADLRLRGPGDILGTAQSGLPPLKLGDLFADAELMKLARNTAFLIFERDPGLEMPENRRFRLRLDADKKMALAHIS
ncbi:MAG: ATP-dependent DNA helicase RecG [Chthoniobacteraceae bacterium]